MERAGGNNVEFGVGDAKESKAKKVLFSSQVSLRRYRRLTITFLLILLNFVIVTVPKKVAISKKRISSDTSFSTIQYSKILFEINMCKPKFSNDAFGFI